MRRIVWSWFILLALAGCGGGGSAGDLGGGEQQVGPMAVQGEVRALAPTVAPGGTSIYALSGNVTRVVFNDANPTVDESEIVFVGGLATGFGIMACSPDGKGLRVIKANVGIVLLVQVIGDYVYYVDPSNNLRRVHLSGTGDALVKADISRFAANLTRTKIYAYQVPSATWPTGRFVSMNLDGTGFAHMFPAPFIMYSSDYFPGLLSDGTLVLVDSQSTSFTGYFLYSASGAGKPGGLNHTNVVEAVAMENGTDFVFHKTSGYTERLLATGSSSWQREVVGYGVRYDYGIAIAPGGSKMAFANSVTQGSLGVLVDDIPGNGVKRIFPQQTLAVAWAPLVTKRVFVGTGGTRASAGAFLFSERGSVLPTVVWADATTRGSITLTKVSVDGALNVVYRLDCDALTALSYTNSLNYTPISVFDGTQGTKGAMISINGETGLVESISTFTRSPSLAVKDGRLEVSGLDRTHRADGTVDRSPGVLTFR